MTKRQPERDDPKSTMRPKVGYMDTIDFEHEIGEAKGGSRIYPSPEDLRANESCVETGCGIVKVRIEVVEVIEEQELYR